MQNEISKSELVDAYCEEKMNQDEYNKMVAFYLNTEIYNRRHKKCPVQQS